jgi:dipeptidyl aminopeptidase/acylaminoacyl peptidase
MQPFRLLCRPLLFAFVLVSVCVAADTAKRPLTPADFDGWRSITTPSLSRDGQWLAYAYMPQDGDGEVVVRELATGRERREPVGALPPTPNTSSDETNPTQPPARPQVRLAFTSDSRFLVATTFPTKGEIAAAKKAKKKPEEMPKSGLLIVPLAGGEATRLANVKNMQVPAKGGAWLAYLKEPKPEEAKPADAKSDSTTKPAEAPAAKAAPAAKPGTDATARGSSGRGSAPATAGGEPKKEYGTDLVLRDLAAPAESAERTFANVAEYSFARDGRTLLFAVSSKTEADNGVYATNPGDPAAPVALLAGKGKYSKLTWDREQKQAAFVSDRDDAAAKAPRFKLYHWPRGAASATAVVGPDTAGLGAGLVPSDKSAPAFSRDGRKLYLATAPPPKPPRAADAAADADKVVADLWHWRDDFVQPMQKVRATQDRNRTYRGVLDLATGRYTQLADAALPTVTLSDDGTRALGVDDRPYRRLVDFDGRYQDVYVVDAATGERKLAVRRIRGGASTGGGASTTAWSPDGRWTTYFNDRQWHALDTATGSTRPLTAGLKVAFYQEDHDTPDAPPAYGSAGWTKDSQSVFVYDRFDVWQVFPDGRPAVNITAGHGRATKTTLRVQRIEPLEEGDEERGIDPAKPLTLRGESEETRATGFFRATLGTAAAPQRLAWGDRDHRYVGRALDADVLLVTAARFDTFPDVHTTDSSFGRLAKVTDGGAQLAPFAWGRAELLSFTNADGRPLRAALFKPANFDPSRKYPLLVYIYERLSQTVHAFVPPAPSQNVNLSFYTSNGYLVLLPDIVYTTGHPGQSALKCVLPAIDAAVRLGCVDEQAVGIQGHSWGGYQVAWLVTQTTRFRAAEAGAPVGNMTSAYSGIRWGSGLPRQFQYEQTQSRIGQSLQAAPHLFLENSPVFHISRVQTPLLLLHNDADDAVPWYQGIELFLALRRHGKEAYLFNYNGALHGLRRRQDQKDFARRMQQFFDHFLKGAPRPEWMERGVPFLEREEEKERFNPRS